MLEFIIQKLFIAFTFLISLQLFADGGFFWDKGADLEEPSQKALIYFEKEMETLVLQVKYRGPAKDFAWVVPLPSKPDVDVLKTEKNIFEELGRYCYYRKPSFPYLSGRGRFVGVDSVEIIEERTVGVYDITILKASKEEALAVWLKQNGYSLPPDILKVLKHYVKKKWVYVAMRINAKELTVDNEKKLHTGSLQPIKFDFKTDKAVYPLKISSINKGETEVLLYALSDVPLQISNTLAKKGLGLEDNLPMFISYSKKTFYDPDYGTYKKCSIKDLPTTWENLKLDKKKELYVCQYRAAFNPEEMKDDLSFIPFDPVKYYSDKFKNSKDLEVRWKSFSFLMRKDNEKYSKLLPEMLEKMAKSDNPKLCYVAAKNPKTPKEYFRRLKGKKHDIVDWGLADNPETPSEILYDLAQSDKSYVSEAALRHKNLSWDHLKILSKNESKLISEKAKEILKGRQQK